MINKIKEKISSLRNSFLELITIKNVIIFFLLVFAGLALLSLFTYLCTRFVAFIALNKDILLLCLTIAICFAYFMYCRHENLKDAQAVQMRYQTKIEEEQEKQQYEDAYLRIQQLLFLVINDTAIITKIPQLKSVSALDAPIHFVFDKGFYVFQYLVAKDNATTSNIIQMKDVLNNRIRQALNAGEIMGKHEMHLSHNSIPYQRILIHDIRDNGSFLQINAVITGHPYTDYIERGKIVSKTTFDNSDLDF